MAEPATPASPRRVELSLAEVRTRLAQIVRSASLTGQVTVIVDRGRPVAEIVPIGGAHGPAGPRPASPAAGSAAAGSAAAGNAAAQDAAAAGNAAAGWMRRIDQVRDAVRRQHAERTATLERAVTDAWAVLDRLQPPGSDRAADELRVIHRDLLAKQPTDDHR